MQRRVRLRRLLRQLVVGSMVCAVASVPLHFGDDAGAESHVQTYRDVIVAVTSKADQASFDAEFAAASSGSKHLVLEEVCAKFGPRASSVSAVEKWATMHRAAMVSATRCHP